MSKIITIRNLTFIFVTALSMQPAKAEPFYFLSMWKSPGEQHALAVFQDEAEKLGYDWINQYSANNFNGTRAEFIKLSISGKAPHAVQWIIGEELTHLIESGLTIPIYDPAGEFRSQLIPEITQAVKVGDALSSVPVGIHTQNHIVFNNIVFESLGLDIPTTIEELLAVIPKIQEKGIIPVAMSDQEWQMRNLFMTIMSSHMNKTQFEDLIIRGATSDELRNILVISFSDFKKITQFPNADYADLPWYEATRKVVRGEAAMQVLGDYIGAELPHNSDFTCSNFPTAKFIVWGADGLVFTEKSSELEPLARQRLVRSFFKSEVMMEYISRKGGIPTINNYDETRLSPCSAQNVATWNSVPDKIWLDSETWRTTLATIGVMANYAFKNPNMPPEEGAARIISTLKSSR